MKDLQNKTTDRVRIPELCTSVHRMQYDFVKRIGILNLPKGACVDMTGAINFFKRIDPFVCLIYTINEKFDTVYQLFENLDPRIAAATHIFSDDRVPSGGWIAIPGDYADKELGSIESWMKAELDDYLSHKDDEPIKENIKQPKHR